MSGGLVWESADTGEPGDQNADSARVPTTCTSAYYSIGPERGNRWGAEFCAVRHGERVSQLGVVLGRHFTSEAEAKAAAQAHEDSPKEPTIVAVRFERDPDYASTEGLFGKPGGQRDVVATFDDGSEDTVFSLFTDETALTEDELIGLTGDEARELLYYRDEMWHMGGY